MPRTAEVDEKVVEQADKEYRKGKLQRFVCKDDCYWEVNRYRPGDIQDFQGEPPASFPAHHFERI